MQTGCVHTVQHLDGRGYTITYVYKNSQTYTPKIVNFTPTKIYIKDKETDNQGNRVRKCVWHKVLQLLQKMFVEYKN